MIINTLLSINNQHNTRSLGLTLRQNCQLFQKVVYTPREWKPFTSLLIAYVPPRRNVQSLPRCYDTGALFAPRPGFHSRGVYTHSSGNV